MEINKLDPALRAQGIWAGFLDKESAPPTISKYITRLPCGKAAGYSRVSNKKYFKFL
jgi:hypothetical protein